MRVGEPGDWPGDEAADLELGISFGLAPQLELDAAGTTGADGEAITRLSSSWNHLRCEGCGHTFRRGDRVRLSSGGRGVSHLVPGLDCGLAAGVGDDPAGHDPAGDEIAEFRDGLLSAWPTLRGLRIRRLRASDWRLPRGPDDVRESNVCLHCGHTFRAGEYVIICPCRPAADGCGRAVHRDPAAGLPCWESWRPEGTVPVCPVTQVRVGPQ